MSSTLEELGAPFQVNGIATIVSVVGAGRRGCIAFGVVWLGVMEALARVVRPRVREVHRFVRLPILGEVRSLLPERKLAKDGLPNLVARIQSPVSISPDVVSQLLNLLQSLGVSQQVMGEIRSKTSQASQKAKVVPARTRRVAELEEKWLKSASHLENLRERMTRKEQDYVGKHVAV